MIKKQGRYVTKSIRLTDEEARVLAELVENHAASESALMRQWVLRGMQAFRIEQAVAAYQRDEVDLRDGAAMAGIPIGAFIDELGARHVAILRDPEVFRKELADLQRAFGRAPDDPADTSPYRASQPSAALSSIARPNQD